MIWLAAVLLGPLLWWGGAVFFDGVHWALHRMLRSRWALLRWLARPHAVHHEWIDRELVTHFDRQRANVFCHIVPEYATQLAFTAALAVFLPGPFVVVLAALQTAVFVGILRLGGLDVNHRPAARIDAHPPGLWTPPSYHALHHAYPDAYFSSYAKVWDAWVGGGLQIEGRQFAWIGETSAFGRALRSAVERAGGLAGSHRAADVCVLLDPALPLQAEVERTIDATRDRQLPPEVWALRLDPEDPLARHYRDDPRVCFRVLHVSRELPEGAAATRLAARALRWLRRDAHFVPLAGIAGWRRHRATTARAPEGVALVRHRLDWVPR